MLTASKTFLVKRSLVVWFINIILSDAYKTAARSDITSGTPTQVWPCAANASVAQSWSIVAKGIPYDNILLGTTGLTLNTLGFINDTGGILNAWSLDPVNPWGQQWLYHAEQQQLVSEINGLCAGALNKTGFYPPGTPIVQVNCTTSGSNSMWVHNVTTGQFMWGSNMSLCLDVGSAATCAMFPFSTYPYCNTSVGVYDRVADLLGRIDLGTMALLMSTDNRGVPELGVPAITYGEALHGVVVGCGAAFGSQTGCPTSFPAALTMSAAFNRSLWKAVGGVISTEARALANQGGASQIFFAPDINPFRDPRWGRGQEVPSEDPLLAGQYAANYIRGFQEGDDPRYLKAVSMAKHFSGYDQEGNNGPNDRTHFCANITYKALVEYFWPPFRVAIQEGHVGGLMCAASGVNGLPSCGRGDYNNGVLRDEYGWDGFFVTDGNGIGYLWQSYGEAPGPGCVSDGAYTPNQACRVGISGGVDVELGDTYNVYLPAAVQDGNVTLQEMLTSLNRSLPWAFRLGLMDPDEMVPYTQLGPADVDTPAARQLALEAAQQAMVLLQNNVTNAPWHANVPLLPMPAAQDNYHTIVVIGPNAGPQVAMGSPMLSNYHGGNTVYESHMPKDAIAARAAAAGLTVLPWQSGCADTQCNGTDGFAAAIASVKAADMSILVMGLSPGYNGMTMPGTVEGEEEDRADIDFPGDQLALIQAVAAVGKPYVVVLIHGGAIALDWCRDNSPAILDALYPGELGGDAIAGALFGDYSPAGRLPITGYPSSFAATRELVDYDFTSGEGVTYLYYTGVPIFPFGWGLSYTTWLFQWFDGSSSQHHSIDAAAFGSQTAQPPMYACNCTNTGNVVSDVTVLGFYSTGLPGEPLQELFDFQRVASVNPGQTVTVYLSVPPEVAAIVTEAGDQILRAGAYSVRLGDHSQWLEGTLEITGPDHTLFSMNGALGRYHERERLARGQ